MTTPSWNVEQVAALADEWVAERDHFLSSLQEYLASQLVAAPQIQALEPVSYRQEASALGEQLVQFLRMLDSAVWYTLQTRMGEFQQQLEARFGELFKNAAARLATIQAPEEYNDWHTAVRQAIGLAQHILRIYQQLQGRFDFATVRFGWRLLSRMKYLLYPVRLSLPVLTRYWLLDDVDPDTCEPAFADPASGIQRYEIDGYRGAYTAYVPETYRADCSWPLLLTMHGGSGNDEDFLWTWLKYAKSRGYLLVSAKSFASTWGPWDAPSILLMLEDMQTRYNVDASRILLTGLSDGGSFGYEAGFAFPERFTGLAVVAGILRPHQRTPQSSQLPVYIAHGEQDQLFPVTYIRMVAAKLREMGHPVTYHEIPDFGHAYPSGENTAILDWFDHLPPRQPGA